MSAADESVPRSNPTALTAVACVCRFDQRQPIRLVTAAAVAAAVVASLARWGADWPAQEFRALIAQSHPLALWANGWFSGQPLGGYSLVYPLLSGALGAAAVGVGSVVAAAWAAGRLLPHHSLGGALAIEGAIVVSLTSSLIQGQLPYLLGTAFGLGALVLDRAKRPVLVAVAAALCCLSSPLAGFFLLLAGAAFTAVRPARQLLPYSTVLIGFLVPLILGGAGGPNPYPATSFAAAAVFAVALLMAFRGHSPIHLALRRFAVLYGIATLVLLPIANPVGGNVARLGMQLALPIACLALQQAARRRRLVLVTAALAAAWSLWPPAVSIAHGARDPSQQRAYFAPLLRYLHSTNHRVDRRVEIPMTREHWESRWVAADVPMARGWERQTDVHYNAVLYHRLTATAYRRWLDTNAVGWVALPDVPLDVGGLAEANLLQHPPAWLHRAWHNAHWQVWQVLDTPRIASAPATLRRLGESTIVLHFRHAGTSLVRVHAASLWQVARGAGCISSTSSGWMSVTAQRGSIVLETGPPGTGDSDACSVQRTAMPLGTNAEHWATAQPVTSRRTSPQGTFRT